MLRNSEAQSKLLAEMSCYIARQSEPAISTELSILRSSPPVKAWKDSDSTELGTIECLSEDRDWISTLGLRCNVREEELRECREQVRQEISSLGAENTLKLNGFAA